MTLLLGSQDERSQNLVYAFMLIIILLMAILFLDRLFMNTLLNLKQGGARFTWVESGCGSLEMFGPPH